MRGLISICVASTPRNMRHTHSTSEAHFSRRSPRNCRKSATYTKNIARLLKSNRIHRQFHNECNIDKIEFTSLTLRASFLVKPSTISIGSLRSRSGLFSATSSMSTPPSGLANSTGPLYSLDKKKLHMKRHFSDQTKTRSIRNLKIISNKFGN